MGGFGELQAISSTSAVAELLGTGEEIMTFVLWVNLVRCRL